MVPADDEHTDSPEADSNTSTKELNSGRLTPMPDCLMKWWIPFGLAGLLLTICTPIAFWWGGHFHWPSSAAMSLCITIAGAGFALSSWQQRSHDNATKENEQAEAQRELETDRQERERIRLEQIERDEYWKRREHIFQLLTSKKPALRLSAIELLAELADTADKSNLLNETTKLQLQRHIIDILCQQLRHEGLDHTNDGDNLEHANIQHLILHTIFTRINRFSDYKHCANWNTAQIKIEDTNILTPITLTDIATEATLDLNSTTFHEAVCIENATLHSLIWERAKFLSTLSVGTDSLYHPTQPSVTLGTETIPTRVATATFNSVTFITESPFFTIKTNEPISNNETTPEVHLKRCNFFNKRCHCTSTCQCRKKNIGDECLCLIKNQCTCNRMCINSQVSFVEASTDNTAGDQQAFFSLHNCYMGRIFLTHTPHAPFITLKDNFITDQIFIFSSDTRKPEPWIEVDIHDNTIFFGGLFTKPIEIATKSLSPLMGAIEIGRNFIADPDNSSMRQEFSHSPININATEIMFTASTPTDFPPLISSWTTAKED